MITDSNKIILNIKPLSVNEAWKGRRFKTDKYKYFQSAVIAMLPKKDFSKLDKIEVVIHYGFSSKLSDIDNPCKLVLDCLCKKYDFDDRQIFKLVQTKEIVSKKSEFINIEIKHYI